MRIVVMALVGGVSGIIIHNISKAVGIPFWLDMLFCCSFGGVLGWNWDSFVRTITRGDLVKPLTATGVRFICTALIVFISLIAFNCATTDAGRALSGVFMVVGLAFFLINLFIDN